MASSPTVLAGTDLTALLVGVPAWIPMTSTSGGYTNAWSDFGGGFVTGQYRLWPLLNSIQITGTIQHAGIAGASNFFTVPAAMFPATAQNPCMGFTNANAIVPIQISATGVLTISNMPAATTLVQFNGWYSLDA